LNFGLSTDFSVWLQVPFCSASWLSEILSQKVKHRLQ